MHAERQGDQMVITFSPVEGQVLRRALRSISRFYRVNPAELDSRVGNVWYSTAGCRSAGMSDQEIREWLANLHALKSAQGELLDRLLQALEAREGGRSRLLVKLAEAASLLTIFNDHRLFLAAEHNIGEAEMDVRDHHSLRKLTPEQQMALFEIHVLAGFVQEVLQIVAPDAADWMEG